MPPNTLSSKVAVREDVKYYFADFVRKGGGGVRPQIRNSFFLSVKGGTPQIRNFFDQKTGVFWAKTQFLGIFEQTSSQAPSYV